MLELKPEEKGIIIGLLDIAEDYYRKNHKMAEARLHRKVKIKFQKGQDFLSKIEKFEIINKDV